MIKKIVVITFVMLVLISTQSFADALLEISGTGATINTCLFNNDNGASYDGVTINDSATGATMTNCTISTGKIGIVADEDCTITNTAVDGCEHSLIAANLKTATVNYSAFEHAKASMGSGTITDTSCLFSVSDFHFVDTDDYRLKAASPLVRTGTTPTGTTDLRGRYIRPPYNIGCYQSQRIFYPGSILSTWSP